MNLSLPARADAVLFDLDGVLVDSRATYASSVNATLEAYGLAPWPQERLHGFLGPPMHETFATLLAGTGREGQLAEIADAYRERARTHAAAESLVFDGVPEMLEALAAAMPLVVATSKTQALAEPLLAALGVGRFFRAVCGPPLDDPSQPKAVTVGQALAVVPEARAPVMIGDRKYDVVGAAEHGVPTVGALWGIGGEEELRNAGAVALARSPATLATLLLGG